MADEPIALLASHPFGVGCTEAERAALVRGAEVLHLPSGSLVFQEGRSADRGYLVVSGTVGLELHVPHRGSVAVATVGPGDLLGWSWLLEPHVWRFDAVARSELTLVALEASAVRAACAADPELDRRVLRQVLRTVARRLEATRHQLIDVYGHERA